MIDDYSTEDVKISIGTGIFCKVCGAEMYHGFSPVSNMCAGCYSKSALGTVDTTLIDSDATGCLKSGDGGVSVCKEVTSCDVGQLCDQVSWPSKKLHINDVIKYSDKPAFTSKRKTYISSPEAKLAAIRTAKDTAKSLGKIEYWNGLEAAHAILQDRPAIVMNVPKRAKWSWFKTGVRG